MDYACSLADPKGAPPACVPCFPALATEKAKVKAKGTATTGTDGFGYVVSAPERSAANDLACVAYSDGTAGGTTIPAISNPPPAGSAYAESDATYESTQISKSYSGVQYKPVSHVLMVRYIGTELDRGGRIVALLNPNHAGMVGSSYTDFQSFDEAVAGKVSSEFWFQCPWKPVETGDTEFHGDFNPSIDDSFYMGFVFIAPNPDTPMTIEWEMWTNFEYSGRTTKAKTLSHNDPVGFSAVHSTASITSILDPHQKHPNTVKRELVKHSTNYIKDAASFVWDHRSEIVSAGKAAAQIAATVITA
jgi:hypothetical protein